MDEAWDHGQPFDIEQPIRSESVVITLCSADAATGLVARLCRYPAAGVAWAWLHGWLPDGTTFGYVDDTLPCDGAVTDTDADDLGYALVTDAASMTLARTGSRETPASARLSAVVPAHPTDSAPLGPGPRTVEVTASLDLGTAAGSTLPGRSEVHGEGSASVVVDGVAHQLAGAGQWHEQHQDVPRFRVPFTYAMLAGNGCGAVLLGGPRGSGGFVRIGDDTRQVTAFALGEPGPTRSLELTFAGGDSVATAVTTAHRYTLPLYRKPWNGSRVTVDIAGHRLAGSLNWFTP